jgi:Secretion system C-terminal sorting domain
MTTITGLAATAQCTPDPQFTSPGVYPDSATGFASACVGVAYDQLITNVVPVDTTTFIGPIPVTLVFDSVVIVNVTGLPPGFAYSCFDGQNVTSPVDQCAFEGGTIGCVSIFGTPNPGDEGSYPLVITVDAYLAGQPTPQATYDVDYYVIEVLPATSCSNGIGEVASTPFTLYPNPVAESFTLNGLQGFDVSSVSITNADGKVMSSYSTVNGASFDINVSDLAAGIYFVHIAHGSATDVVRFIKE